MDPETNTPFNYSDPLKRNRKQIATEEGTWTGRPASRRSFGISIIIHSDPPVNKPGLLPGTNLAPFLLQTLARFLGRNLVFSSSCTRVPHSLPSTRLLVGRSFSFLPAWFLGPFFSLSFPEPHPVYPEPPHSGAQGVWIDA